MTWKPSSWTNARLQLLHSAILILFLLTPILALRASKVLGSKDRNSRSCYWIFFWDLFGIWFGISLNLPESIQIHLPNLLRLEPAPPYFALIQAQPSFSNDLILLLAPSIFFWTVTKSFGTDQIWLHLVPVQTVLWWTKHKWKPC